MKKKIIITAITVIVLGVLAYLAFFNKTKDDYILRTDKASMGDIKVEVTSTGSISAITQVDVGCQVSGIITHIYADYNSIVKKGQIIAKIDSTNLIKTLNDAKTTLERSQVSFDVAKKNYDRVHSLLLSGLESQVDDDNAYSTYMSAKTSLDQAKSSIDNAKQNLDYATIYAPCNGVVVDKKINPGQTVQASMSSPTLFSIANDLTQMQVQATIDETDIGKIDNGQEVTFTTDAFPDERFSGTIYQIRLAPSVSNNVVNYIVIIDVRNDQLKLMPGMTASVKIKVAEKNNVLKVPNMALRFNPPKDLTDTVKVKEALAQRMNFAFDQPAAQSNQQVAAQGQKPQAQQQGNRQPGQGRNQQPGQGRAQQQGQNNQTAGERARSFAGNFDFQKFRDSLKKALGREVTREDMQAALAKRMPGGFGNRQQGNNNRQQANNKQQANSKTNQKNQTQLSARINNPEAGITAIEQKYPLYRKSSYSPANTFGMGRIWIKGATGKLEPVYVRTGVTDGRYTEIISDKIQPDQEIVISATSTNAASSSASTSPLMQQQNQQRQMGGPGGPGGGGASRGR